MRKDLPIGIQSFERIRRKNSNYIYVDKTKTIYDLVRLGGYKFLSRPRRFGKSLTLSTISELFEGNKDLFEGLYIYNKWDWDVNYPVIRLDFSIGNFSTTEQTQQRLIDLFNVQASRFDITLDISNNIDFGTVLESLILKLNDKYNKEVVILIDEYDKPIIDNISERPEVAIKNRDLLRSMYSVFKTYGNKVHFGMLTGVSKFSKMHLFSGANNLDDISIDENFATIVGYTQTELENYFDDYLQNTDLQKVKKWYNGYNYLGKPIYNPFDVLLFLSKGKKFRNYWWETGSPKFLIEILQKGNYYLPDLENKVVTFDDLGNFDVENIDLPALLWQTGYLTFNQIIEDDDEELFKLGVPNLEVQKSLNNLFFSHYTGIKNVNTSYSLTTKQHLKSNDIQGFIDSIKVIFASIPYNNYVQNTLSKHEGYFASVIFSYISGLGYRVITEDPTNLGRIDMTIFTAQCIYIIEFKVDVDSTKAIDQIVAKKYHEKYSTNTVVCIGINFSSKERNIADWQVKRYDV